MNTVDLIKKHRFIAIFRHIDPVYAADAAQAVYDGGVRLFEITFDPSKPNTIKETQQIIKTIIGLFSDDVCVGAGTVIKQEFAEAAYEAGARFIVSPCTNEGIIRYTKEHGMASLPGAYTASEIMRAYELGADIVKIFPIAPDQIGYLKNIISPLSHIPFIPTGGINPDTIDMFMELGAAAVAAGASVVTQQLCESGEYERIRENAARHTAAAAKYV